MVSGVFYNRIKKGMMLQSDITVLYALQNHSEYVSCEDLKVKSPYNTYLHPGVPIGPVSSIGSEALDAAVNPGKNDYYYFFATQGEGKVLYSKTYEEHLKISKENAWE